MNNTLVIGDLHLDNKIPGMLESQVESVKRIIEDQKHVTKIVFLGDVFMMRRPKPSVLLAFREIVEFIKNLHPFAAPDVFVLRGNHDSENKNDDGITALSLYDYPWLNIVTEGIHTGSSCYIPHYEDEETIKSFLRNSDGDTRVFGHFGYFGSLNSAGDNDFSLVPDDFKCRTYLGHIHKYKREKNITVVGTPYTTSFSEAGKDNYYLTIGDGKDEAHLVEFGPRHVVVEATDLADRIEYLNDPNYFTLVRIIMTTQSEEMESIAPIIDQLNVGYCEIKYSPVIRELDVQSDYNPEDPVYEISDELVEEYINHSETKLGKDVLLEGLKTIHENQRS